MLLTRAERTDISWGIVNEPVSNHFIFTFEPLPTNASRAAFNWTVVGAILRMHIGMRAVVKKRINDGSYHLYNGFDLLQKVLSLERRSGASGMITLEGASNSIQRCAYIHGASFTGPDCRWV